jgi:large conductance mechanosensitive channel
MASVGLGRGAPAPLYRYFAILATMKSFIQEFKKFALRGNAIDLAIGVVIGAAFNAVTTSLVNNVMTPPLSLLTKGINFSDLAINIPNTDAHISYGLFIQALISFVITAFALFLLVQAMNKLAAAAKKDQEDGTAPPPEKSAELQVLEDIRDALKAPEKEIDM